MNAVLFVPLFAAIALLARPGYISSHPLTGSLLSGTRSIILQRTVSALIMVPSIWIMLMQVPGWMSMSSRAWTALIFCLLIPPVVAFFQTRHAVNTRHTEFFSDLKGGVGFWSNYLIVTIVYMAAYEILLRGVFLFFLVERIGIIYAVIMNILAYAAMHLFKDRKETLLCIPVGLLLCWLTLYTGSIWPAVALHCTMAISFEYLFSRQSRHDRS